MHVCTSMKLCGDHCSFTRILLVRCTSSSATLSAALKSNCSGYSSQLLAQKVIYAIVQKAEVIPNRAYSREVWVFLMRNRFLIECYLAIVIVAASTRKSEASGSVVYSATGRNIRAKEGLTSLPPALKSPSRDPDGSCRSNVCNVSCMLFSLS